MKIKKGPAAYYRHNHPPVKNVNELFDERLTFGQRLADKIAAGMGSWPFIISQTIIITIWIAVNVYLVIMIKTNPEFLKAWDPYPFILLNLALSLQAAYTGPVVMMSQNRQADKDRLTAQQDYEINIKAEEEIKVIMSHLCHHDQLIEDIMQRLEKITSLAEKGQAPGDEPDGGLTETSRNQPDDQEAK